MNAFPELVESEQCEAQLKELFAQSKELEDRFLKVQAMFDSTAAGVAFCLQNGSAGRETTLRLT